MPITYDIDTDYLYNKGVEKGVEKGIQEGIEKGIEKLIINLLRNSSMSPEEIARTTKIPLEKVLEIKNSIKD